MSAHNSSPTSLTFQLGGFFQPSEARRSFDSTANLMEPDATPESAGDWSDYYWTVGPLPQSPISEQKKPMSGDIFYGWRTVVFGSWLNILLIMLPISWIISATMKSHHNLVFASCTLALIPLVKLHDLSTRDLAIRIGGSRAGLVNASLSNIVEIVLAISALRKCELQVVQSALIGSILSKLLLILGLCFFAGGMRFSEQGFDATATQIHSSLLNISVGAVLIPVVYHFTLGDASDQSLMAKQTQDILHMSHGVSIVLLIIYGAYLLFQLWSHTHLYHDNHNKKSNRLHIKLPVHLDAPGIFRATRNRESRQTRLEADIISPEKEDFSPVNMPPFPQRPYLSSQASASELNISNLDSESARTRKMRPLEGQGRIRDLTHVGADSGMNADSGLRGPAVSSPTPTSKAKEPQLSWQITLLLLVAVTAAVAITADWLVGSLDGVSMHISKQWVGLIVLPVVSSIAECITAINVSVKDQLSLSVSVAIGSALQTALFVIPFSVILGWISHRPLSLLMDPFQSLVLYVSVQTAGYVISDGKSNWLEGMMLICLYVIVAVSFWYYPGTEIPALLTTCNA